jgi:hypothetical protein
MRAILKQGLFLLIALAGIYAVLLAASHLFVRSAYREGGLDSSLAASTIFMTDPKYVFLNRAALKPGMPRIVFVGASNTAVGFKQREVQALLPDAEVDNLAVGGSNMTQIAQIVDLVQELQSAAARRRTTFVIGMWYGTFVQDRFRWNTPDRHAGDTDIDIERYRYGFYRRTEHGPQQVLPPADLPLGLALIHPYLVFDQLSRRASQALRERLFGRAASRTDAERDSSLVSSEEKETALRYWREQMHSDGPIAGEQFLILSNLIDRILSQGSKVVLVDLPIPRWHAQRSPFYQEYLGHRKALLSELAGRDGFAYLEMMDLSDDLEFSDEVHPKPRVTRQWAARVAALIGTVSDIPPESRISKGSTLIAGQP